QRWRPRRGPWSRPRARGRAARRTGCRPPGSRPRPAASRSPTAPGSPPGGPGPARSHAVEELLFLAGELLVADQALLAQLVELADLVGDGAVVAPAFRGGGARGDRHAHPVELAVLVGLDLAVDLVLHGRRVAHVGEGLAPHLARGLDDEVARPHDALEDRLAEEHGVDPVERDLDAVLGQDAVAVDEPVAGDHEVGGDPPEVAPPEPAQEP